MKKAKGIVWDLSALYESERDPGIERDIEAALALASAFRKSYQGSIVADNCTAEHLKQALIDYERLIEKGYRPYAMANLLFTGNGKADVFKAMVARVQEALTRINNETLFFALEIQKIPEKYFAEVSGQTSLRGYRHYLESLRQFTPYMLSEKEEQVINRKNLSGKTAFVNLFDEFTTAFEWQMDIKGEKTTLTQSEMRELLHDRDSKLREKVKRALDGKFGDNALIFTNIFGNLIKDHANEMEIRGYDNPIQPRHLSNKAPKEVVDTMMQVTAENYPIVQDYFRLKAKLLGVKKLNGSDLLAPVSKADPNIPFETGKAWIIDSFNRFSPEFGDIIARGFDEHWIDAEVRTGKRGGAFCYSVAPSVHPFILMNYVDNLDSVYTMAHEFGHAVHSVLASQSQTLLTFSSPLILAETASVFAEMLLTRKLLTEQQERDYRIQIIAAKLEDFFGTISRQTMYTYFELDAHQAGANRRLSADDFCQLWLKRRDEMYGDTVNFLEEEKWFWAVIPHFIHTRFYCYAYTFGALFVLALFNQYEQQGDAFVPGYRKLLAAGDSAWPADLIKEMGMDFSDRNFWAGGFTVIHSLLAELKTLVD